MEEYEYIREISPVHRIKVLVSCLFGFGILLFLGLYFYGFWYKFFRTAPVLSNLISYLGYNIANTTPLGLFYGHFIGSIFFMPSLDELVFYYGLMNGNPLLFSFLAAIFGFMLAQILNYFIGFKLSGFMLHLVSKKKVYKTKRWINKYGGYGIFVFNIIPLPAPLLVFALGVTKYNFKRLFVIALIAKSLEYTTIIGIFLLLSA